jgi:hypothetical protein
MTNPALAIIEEAYSIALNPELDYWAQLQPLAPNGELANRLTSNQVLFRVCKIVDAQAKEIQALKDDRVAIANKMVELEEYAKTTNTTKSNPSEPIQPIA